MLGDNNDLTVVICFTIFFIFVANQCQHSRHFVGDFLLDTPHIIPITNIVISSEPPRLHSHYYNNNNNNNMETK